MAPKGVSNWRRPYTSIYNDNYRYGTGLYSDTLTDIEKRYSESVSKTQLRSDRPDLAFTTFSGSSLTSSPNPGGDYSSRKEILARQTSQSAASPTNEISKSATFESRLNTALHSAYALDEEVEEAINRRMEQRKKLALAKSATEDCLESSPRPKSVHEEASPRPKSLYDDASFFTLPKLTEAVKPDRDLDTSKSRRKPAGRLTSTNGPTSSVWKEKSNELQDQVDSLDKSISDTSSKLRSELSSLKAKYHTELSDLSSSVDSSSQQVNELQRVCKRQSNQLLELQSAYDDAQKNVQDSLEQMSTWQSKCKSLKKEMDRLREEVEQAVHKSSKA